MPDSINAVVVQISGVLSHVLLNYGGATVTVLSLSSGIVSFFILLWVMRRFSRWFIRRLLSTGRLEKRTIREALVISRGLLWLVGVWSVLNIIGIGHALVLLLLKGQHDVTSLVDLKLFSLGKTQLTLWSTVYLVVLSWLLVRVTGQVETWFVDSVLARTALDRGMREALAATLRYFIVLLGFVVILQLAGIDLSALTVLAGALGVALGLGLQSMLANVVGGLVILFERPVKLGDRIEVGHYSGDVTHISLRATTIVTNDNVAIIVPNSQFTSSNVINWTYTGNQCRFKIPVKTVISSDPAQVKSVLLGIADEHPGILKSPPPTVILEGFGDNYLSFTLFVWSSAYVTHPASLRSDINFTIMEKFEQNGLLLLGQSKPEMPAADAKIDTPQQQIAAEAKPQQLRRSPGTKSA